MADRVYGRHIVESLKCEGSGWRGGTTGHGMCRCPAHDDSKASLSVKDTGDRVVINCFAMCDFQAIVRELRAMGLWDEWDGNGERVEPRHRRRQQSRLRRQAQAVPGNIPVPDEPEPEDTDDPDDEYISPEPEPDEIARRLAAREIWRHSRPIGDDAAKLYLWSRRIDIRRVPPTLRFSPSLFYSRDEQLYPALVGAMTGENRLVSAVQRIWVTSTLETINGVGPANNKAPLPTPKKTLGVMGDGAVRLAPADRTLGIAEGIETGLSAQQYWSIPVWVSCGAWRMDRIWIPEGVERIIIFGDNGEEGHKAAHKASLAYHARGLECDIEFPPDEYNDWNDVLTGNKRITP
jgi:putative DNA primase/helicase